LATLTRNDVTFVHTTTPVPMVADPTPDHRRALELIGATIPSQVAA
jgi:hypothetical protein